MIRANSLYDFSEKVKSVEAAQKNYLANASPLSKGKKHEVSPQTISDTKISGQISACMKDCKQPAIQEYNPHQKTSEKNLSIGNNSQSPSANKRSNSKGAASTTIDTSNMILRPQDLRYRFAHSNQRTGSTLNVNDDSHLNLAIVVSEPKEPD